MTAKLREAWGRRLRAIREEQQISQSKLAQLSGIPQGAISRLERGLVGAGDETRMAIARALGRNVEDIWTYPTQVAS